MTNYGWHRMAFLAAAFVFSIFQIQIYLLTDTLPDLDDAGLLISSMSMSHNETPPQQPRLERRHKGNLLYTCTLRPRYSNKYDAAWRRVRLATAIVFQSNSGYQLDNFMAYYLPVIGSGSIVIIDHYMEGREIDPGTVSLLDKHNKLGSDVWQCSGSFLYKAEMWSDIVNQYTSSSKFVFPLDVDEYVAVIKPQPVNIIENGADMLSWNYKEFSKALISLPETGKPFKMEGGVIFPMDCGNITWPRVDQSLSTRNVGRTKDHTVTCMDKVFMRGKEFEATDGGNHLGKTHNFPQRLCPNDPLPEQKSTLFLIHMQVNSFNEWLLHGLKGAAARGYNKFSDLTKCFDGMVSGHYCQFWQDLIDMKLDPWQMQKLYRESVCSAVVENNEPIPFPKEIMWNKR